jgi:hypothetical protein
MRPATPISLAFATLLVACESAPPPREEPPPVLANALGALDLGPTRVSKDDPRELLAYDFEPFIQAGLSDAGWTLQRLLQELLSSRAAATSEREGTVLLIGHVLAIRAERPSLDLAQAFLSRLEAEKTQPIALDIHLVSVPDERLSALDVGEPKPLGEAFFKGLDADLASGAAQTLIRRRLRLTPGKRRSIKETTSRRPVVRIGLEEGLPTTEQETVEDGVALHATCWLSGGGAAMTHLEFALQREAPKGRERTLAASYHLPKREGKKAEEIQAAIDLPRLRLTGLRTQARLQRGRWQAVAAGPSVDTGRRVVALARADWAQEPGEAIPGAAKGHTLESLRVAVLQRGSGAAEEAEARKSVFFGHIDSGAKTSTVLRGLKGEYARQSSVLVRNELNLDSGRMPFFFGEGMSDFASNFNSSGQSQSVAATPKLEGWSPLLPSELETKRKSFGAVRWGRTTRLLLAWDQLHVVQSQGAIRELKGLIRGVEAWRNRPLRVRAEWLTLSPSQADALRDPEALAKALPQLRERRILSPYVLETRSGAWTELSLVENEGVLWGFLGDDRPSPEIRFVPRGSRLSLRPRRYGSGRVELKVRFSHDQARAKSLEPVARAEGLIHKPESRQARAEQVLRVQRGQPQLLLAGSTRGGRVEALVVTCWD